MKTTENVVHPIVKLQCIFDSKKMEELHYLITVIYFIKVNVSFSEQI